MCRGKEQTKIVIKIYMIQPALSFSIRSFGE